MAATVDGERHTVGIQCTYDATGRFIDSGAAAGTLDKRSPLRNPIGHLVHDVGWYDALRVVTCGCSTTDTKCLRTCGGHDGVASGIQLRGEALETDKRRW